MSAERSNITGMLQEIQTLLADIPIQHRVLRQLVFENMESRWDQIPDAEPDTCRWLLYDGYDNGVGTPDNEYGPRQDFQDASCRRATRQDFLHWLRAGDGIMHISGNAGSGKSTLLKFIGRQVQTKLELAAWAADRELVFGEFYFWNAGVTAQRTLPGLYRSILFQVLGRCPSLIEKVFPTQLRAMKASRGDALVERAQYFTDEHVQKAFDLLLQETSQGKHKIFLIIDGLDEYEGNRLAHEALAKRLRGWTTHGNVKLLVSSRPWPEFLEPLRSDALSHPAIHLHTLNRFDIRTYCTWRFQSDWEAHSWPDLYQYLVAAVVEQSQGVFLWAHLVLENLLQGIRQRDSLEVLEAKVLEAPSDINALYDKLREPIEKSKIDRTISNRMLLLAARNPFNADLSAMALSWLGDEPHHGLLDPNFPAETTRRPYTGAEVSQRLDRVARRVDGLARGLLQVVWPGRTVYDVKPSFNSLTVQFCHRTARDYLLQDEHRYKKLLASFPSFEEVHPYERICLAEIIFDSDTDRISSLYDLRHTLGSAFCHDFDPKIMQKFGTILSPTIEPLWLSTFKGSSAPDTPSDQNTPRRISFVQHAAYYGFDRFVLSEVDNHPAEELSSPGTSILLSAMRGECELGFDLLKRNHSMDNLVKIYPGLGKDTMYWPAWVLLLGRAVAQSFTNGSSLEFVAEYGWPILRATHEHSVATSQPVHIILTTVSSDLAVTKREETDFDRDDHRVSTNTLLHFFEWLVEGETRNQEGEDDAPDDPTLEYIMTKNCLHLHRGSLPNRRVLEVAGLEFNSQIIIRGISSRRLSLSTLEDVCAYRCY